MDKKGIIAIALSVIILIGWQVLYVNKHRVPPRPVEPVEESAVVDGATIAATTPGPAAPAPATPAPAANSQAVPTQATEAPVDERREEVSTELVTYDFTNAGGGISRIVLKTHKGEGDEPVILNRFATSAPVGAIGTEAGAWQRESYEMSRSEDGRSVTFRRPGGGGIEIVKTYRLPNGDDASSDYVVDLEIEFRNPGDTPLTQAPWYVNLGSAAAIHPGDLPTYTAFDWYRGGKAAETGVNWFEAGRVPLLGMQFRDARSVFTEAAVDIGWAAVKNQYFTTLAAVIEGSPNGVWATRTNETLDGKPIHAIQGALGLEGFTLEPGATIKTALEIFAGPKEYTRLKAMGHDAADVMQLGMFKPVSIFLLKMMNWLKSVIGNYAGAIFFMTLIIKSAMWPLQNTATKSMKKMQALQPKMAELREKYKDDPTRMNQELMKLYKDYGINPFSGCLPMVVQIPIFFGFYRMLAVAPELRNSSFLWINDLSQPDTVFHIGPFPLNVLPLIMAATMLWQMSITPKSGDPVQQRIFMFVPLIFVVFCYNFASALALYWTVQNLFSIVQLYATRNQSIPALKKVAAAEPQQPGRSKKKTRRPGQ